MSKYNHSKIEKKWQKVWQAKKIFRATDKSKKPKYYALVEFPYPSGAGMHVGHVRSYTALDVISRKRRMEGYNVLYPMGWDAFGLPTENYAIKTGIAPQVATKKNTDTFRRQLQSLGYSFDWSREINTTDPSYYKWTQWLFQQFFKHNLAYKQEMAINWCLSCKTGLANEEVVNGNCERCGGIVEQRQKEQWMLKITAYADKLLAGLKDVDYLPEIKAQQENWIGRSEGAEIEFPLASSASSVIPGLTRNPSPDSTLGSNSTTGMTNGITIFTTRPDTLFGATYLVLAPEHPSIKSWKSKIENWSEVAAYIERTKKKTDLERTADEKDKSGVQLRGIVAINPANKEEVPVWISDYVLATYGTGAIMAVPAHDERDFAFAKKFNLPIRQVIMPVFQADSAIDASRPKKKIENRSAVLCIIKHPTKDAYLFVEHNQSSATGVVAVSGGIESGETLKQAALREIREETGYQNVKFIREIPFNAQFSFYRPKSDTNRTVKFFPVYLELVDEVKSAVTEEEKKIQEPVWVPAQEIGKRFTMSRPFHLPIWQALQEGGMFYVGSGVLINSGKFDGWESEVAKKEISKFVGGETSVKYKLRDWVFSRQRYWGEPIPLVHCEQCGKRPKVILAHGLYGHNQENWFPWLKSELEKRGYEVVIPNLPSPEHPRLAEWIATLKAHVTKYDRVAGVIGHSLGGPTACQFLRAAKLHTHKLILVAPTGASQGDINWQNLRAEGCSERSIECIREFNRANEKLSEVAKYAKERIIYLSDNDPYIPLTVRGDYKSLRAKVKVFKDHGHFGQKTGEGEFAKILAHFPEVKKSPWVLVPESQLPVVLPKVEKYQPTNTGESPLAKIEAWVKTTCPQCGSKARRETDTMPNWAGSSWYYLGYLMSKKAFKSRVSSTTWNSELASFRHFMPVDLYNGGMEHVTLHLLYSRFWNLFLYDQKLVLTKEPYRRRTAHGMILAADGKKMSKSLGNVVNPDDLVKEFGADSLRLYELFIGPFNQAVSWDPRGILGCNRFLEKVWRASLTISSNPSDVSDPVLVRLLNQTIKKVGEDIESFNFNTAISSMMIFANALSNITPAVGMKSATHDSQARPEATVGGIQLTASDWQKFIKILSPFAPHMAEELSAQLKANNKKLTTSKKAGSRLSAIRHKLVCDQPWPEYDPKLLIEDTFELVVQVNGRTRAVLSVQKGITQAQAERLVLVREEIKRWVQGDPKKVIFVPNRLINLIV